VERASNLKFKKEIDMIILPDEKLEKLATHRLLNIFRGCQSHRQWLLRWFSEDDASDDLAYYNKVKAILNTREHVPRKGKMRKAK